MGLVVAAPLAAPSQVYTFRYAKSWGGVLADGFTDVALDAAGNAYAVGFTATAVNNIQLLVVKYSSSGNVVWSRSNIDPLSSQDAHLILNGNGDVLVAYKKGAGLRWNLLSSSTGATLNSRNDSFIDTEIDDMKFHAPTNSAILLFQGSPSTSQFQYKVSSFDAVTLDKNWDRSLTSLGPPVGKLAVAGDGAIYVGRNGGTSTRVQRVDPVNGNILWTTDHEHTTNSSNFDIRILNGTFNPIIAPNNTNDGVVKILSKTTGGVSRTDTFPSPIVGLMPGPSATYTSAGKTTFSDFQSVFAKGERATHGSTGFLFGSFLSDGAGQPHCAGFVGPNPSFPSDLGFLHSGSGQLGLTTSSFTSGQATATATLGARVVAVGHVVDSAANQQARIVNFTLNRDANGDAFGYRLNTMLKVPSPGVRINDSLAHNVSVTLVTPPTHGTLTLDTDGGFTYQPDTDSRSFDSFTYRIGPNANDLATVSLSSFEPGQMTASPGSVIGGNPVAMALAIGPSTLTALPVSITDDATGVAFPATVSVPAGNDKVFFNGITVGVAANQNVTATATLDGLSVTTNFAILAATPASITLNPNALVGGQGFTGTVTGSGPANTSGYAISITHSGTEITTPISVFMNGGSSNVIFNGSTVARSTSVTHTVTATARGVSKSATLTINPGGLFAVTVAPTSIKGGTNAQGKIQTAGVAPAGGTLVAVSADGPQVTVPPTVTVDAGQQFKTFVVTSSAVSSTTPRTIIASFGTVIKTTTLTLTP